MFGGAKDFCPNLLQLTRKICVSKMIKTFRTSHKKGLRVYYGEENSQNQTYFDSQSHSSHNQNEGVETSVPKFCLIAYFQRFCPDF